MHRLTLTVFASLLGLTAPALAQDVQNFRPAAGTWHYLSVEGARVARSGAWVPSLVLHYANQPLVARDDSGEVVSRVVEHLATADLSLAVGLPGRLELDLDMPLSFVDGDEVRAGLSLGDARVTPRVQIAGPGQGEDGAGLVFSAPVSLPTGDKERFVGADQFTVEPKMALEMDTGALRFALNGGVRLRPKTQHVESLQLGHELTYGLAVGLEVVSRRTELLAEVFGAAPLADAKTDSRSRPLEVLIGARTFTLDGAVLLVGGGLGLVPDYGTPVYRLLASVAYHDRDMDVDGDGLEDKADACPEQAEDRDGFADSDGCPDPDNDQDGVLDEQDQCRDAPETKNRWQDADGCPDEVPDADGDGVADPDDRCPTSAEDLDGWQDADGCPDPDDDGDGILDGLDKCPREPETRNGYQDEDGCPDEATVRVQVKAGRIEILESIYFETGRALIKPISFDVLDEVAEVMSAEADLGRVRVEGHTDSQGDERFNKQLSRRRARAVRAYLIRKGVDADRLEAEGYGEERPIDTNATAEGRAANRRVEFLILDGAR